jgi:hypothetical protein
MIRGILISLLLCISLQANESYKNKSNQEMIKIYQISTSKSLPLKLSDKSTINSIFSDHSYVHLKIFLDNREYKNISKNSLLHIINKKDVPSICSRTFEIMMMDRGIGFLLDYYNYDGVSLFKYMVDFNHCKNGKKVELKESKPIQKVTQSPEATVAMLAQSIKQKLPVDIDNVTTFYDVKHNKNELILYKSIDTKHKDISIFPIGYIKDNIYKIEKNMTCNSTSKVNMLKSDIKFTYKYSSKESKKELFSYTFDKNSCN